MNLVTSFTTATGAIPQTTAWPVDVGNAGAVTHSISAAVPPTVSPPDQPLHRLAEVRRQEGLTCRRVASLLGISVHEVEKREQPSSDMLLSELYHWRKVLGVPITELLNESDGELSPPVQLRTQLLRAMKTVRSIQARARQIPICRLAEALVEQLIEVMPELKDTAAWPAVGHRRKQSELGQAFLRGLALGHLDELERPE